MYNTHTHSHSHQLNIHTLIVMKITHPQTSVHIYIQDTDARLCYLIHAQVFTHVKYYAGSDK